MRRRSPRGESASRCWGRTISEPTSTGEIFPSSIKPIQQIPLSKVTIGPGIAYIKVKESDSGDPSVTGQVALPATLAAPQSHRWVQRVLQSFTRRLAGHVRICWRVPAVSLKSPRAEPLSEWGPQAAQSQWAGQLCL